MSDKDFIQDPDRGATDPFEQYNNQFQDFAAKNTSSFDTAASDSFPFSDSDGSMSLPEGQKTKDIFELDESLFSPPSDSDAPIFSFDAGDAPADATSDSAVASHTPDEGSAEGVAADDALSGEALDPQSNAYAGDVSAHGTVYSSDALAEASTASDAPSDIAFTEATFTDSALADNPVSSDATADGTADGSYTATELDGDSPKGDANTYTEVLAEDGSSTPEGAPADASDAVLAHDDATQVNPVADDGQLSFTSPFEAAATEGDIDATSVDNDFANDVAQADDSALTQTLPPAILPTGTSNDSDEAMLDKEEGDQPEKSGRFTKKFVALLTGAVVLVALIGGAIGYYVYYQDRALPGTQLAGVDVSGQKQNEIEKLVASKQKDLRVTFAGDIDNKQAFPLDKMGATIDAKKTAAKVLTPNASLGNYITAPFSTRSIEPDYTIEPAQTAAFAVELSSSAPGAKDPVEPHVQLSDDKETFTIVEGEDGVGVSAKDVEAAAKQAITTFKNTSKNVTVAPTQPFLSVDDLKPIEEQANELSSLKVTLTVGDKQVEPERSTKAAWVVLPEGATADKPTISDEHVREWVDEQASSIAVEPQPGKQYVSSSGKVLKTESEPVDGKKVTNQEDIAKQIKSTMEENKPFEDSLETEVVKAEVDKKVIADGAENLAYMAAPGEKWVDINLRNRTVTPYVGATAQAGPFLMVPGLPATPTVTGSFKVWHKTRSQTMEGFNTDGSRYKVPGVQWNTFFHSGYAMHAAHWRSTFGPGAGGGSHGCVNMDFSGAKYIYDFAPIGTPVVSHY